MRYIVISLISILCIAAVSAQKNMSGTAKSPRIEKIINSDWTFNYFPDENAEKGFEIPGYDDSKWPAISIPHTWSTYETTGSIHPFIRDAAESDNPYWWSGWGWYRKHFTISQSYSDFKVFIEFEGVRKYCKVWINGKYLGDHKGGYGSFDFDITPFYNRGKDNVIAVAVNNLRKDKYAIPPMAAGNFNVYGGIYRDVTIVLKDKLYIPMQGSASHEGGTFITTPGLTVRQGVVRIQTWVKNDYPQPKNCQLNTYIQDASGKVVQVIKSKITINPGQLYKFDQTSKPVKNPHLWSPDDPYLYKVFSEVVDGDRVTDGYMSPLGFRWFRWDYKENILYVNGTKTRLQGGNRHQEYPWLGDAIPKWITRMDFKDIAENLNYNFMRTAHYPNDKMVYDLADSYGIVIDEETPSIKNQDFSAEVQEQQMKEMIRRDRNHPSIMFWSIGNDDVEQKFTVAEDTTRVISTGRIPEVPAGPLKPDGTKSGRSAATQTILPGVPAKLTLTGSHQKIAADKGSVIILTADITDAKGVHVNGATNTVKWTVTGPANLAGPAIYESDIDNRQSMEGVWYTEMPVSNVIRSTGKTGKIHVVVSATGLASSSFDIVAEEIKPDNSIITEPPLSDEGRRPVSRQEMVVDRLDEIPKEIKLISEDINLGASDRRGYAGSIRNYIIKNNPGNDSSTVEFRALVTIFATYLVNNNGRLVADDYNFNADHYNNCRLISGYINATKLPPLFKDGLKKYYAEAIIMKGTEKNAGDEMNWMNWIPSGGTVVISQEGAVPSWPKGTIITNKTDLTDLIIAVHPVFSKYTDEAKERALIFIGKMNPYVKAVTSGDKLTYIAERGKPVLIPLIKFISQ